MTRKKTTAFCSNGRCLAYLRVSSGMQVKSGLGLMAQGDTCQREARKLGLLFRQDVQHDSADPPRTGFFTDEGNSAFRKSTLAKRAAGGALLDHVETGDTIIIAKMDRGWRNLSDFILTADELTERGIRLVICDPKIDMGTATGRMLAQYLAMLAEWESGRRSERIIAALAAKKARNCPKTPSEARTVETLDSDWRPPQREDLEAKPGEPGRIFIYIRCSHRDSADSGLGMLAQGDQARNYANWLIEENPALELTEVFTDAVVSASKQDLRNRLAGKRMDQELRAGDHVVFANLDRGFRNVRDMANTMPDWLARGIHVHFASEVISMDDPGGKLLAGIIVQFAEMESELTSARTAEARAQNAARGRFLGGQEPTFWKVYEVYRNGKRVRQLILDRRKILAFRLMQFLRHHRKLTIKQAAERCEELFAKKDKRPAIPQTGVMPRTILSGMLPRGYPRDKEKKAFPVMTEPRYQECLRNERSKQALEAWRKQAAERRKMRGET